MSISVVSGSGNGAIATVDSTSKAARVTLYDSTGAERGTQTSPLVATTTQSYLLPGSFGAYSVASFRTLGLTTGTTPWPAPLCTIRNNGGSKDIALRRVAVEIGYSAAVIDLALGNFRLFLNTGVTPSGGAAPTKHRLDSRYPASQAATEILFSSSADGVAAALTHALPATTAAREQMRTAILTAAGVVPQIDFELLTFTQSPIFVRANETAAFILVSNAVDVATRHYQTKIVFEEVAQ